MPVRAYAAVPQNDYRLFVASPELRCSRADEAGNAIGPDGFDDSIFRGIAIAEESAPGKGSDDEGDAIYVLYDRNAHLAVAKIMDFPGADAHDGIRATPPTYVMQRASTAPAHVSEAKDLSRVSMRSGIKVGSTVRDVIEHMGRHTTYNPCDSTVTYALSRFTTADAYRAAPGSPNSTITFTVTGPKPSDVVTRIAYFPGYTSSHTTPYPQRTAETLSDRAALLKWMRSNNQFQISQGRFPSGAAADVATVRGTSVTGFVSIDSPFTGVLANGKKVLVVLLASGGSMGAPHALVFIRDATSFRYVGHISSPSGHLDIAIDDGVLKITEPIYGPRDSQCCPSRHHYIVETVSNDQLRQIRAWNAR